MTASAPQVSIPQRRQPDGSPGQRHESELDQGQVKVFALARRRTKMQPCPTARHAVTWAAVRRTTLRASMAARRSSELVELLALMHVQYCS